MKLCSIRCPQPKSMEDPVINQGNKEKYKCVCENTYGPV